MVGGLTAEGRARREKVPLQAAQMFEHDMGAVWVARCLRVSTKSAYQWRRCWRGGMQGLSRGPVRRIIPAPRVPSMRLPVLSVQPARLQLGIVPLVMRR
jgi:hypothetical protein